MRSSSRFKKACQGTVSANIQRNGLIAHLEWDFVGTTGHHWMDSNGFSISSSISIASFKWA